MDDMLYNVCYVVFTNDSDHWWSRWLHRSIKHCYIVKPYNGKWVYLERDTHGINFDVIDELDQDATIVKSCFKKTRSPMLFNNCVGVAKQALGIGNPLIITPYQLFKRLSK